MTGNPSIRETLGLAGTPAGGIAERAVATIVAGAVGDAFGYAVEFSRLDSIRARFGASGLTEPVRDDGKLVVSDDTQMTLFTLEGLVLSRTRLGDRDAVLEAIREAYRDWYATQTGDPRAADYHGRLGAQPVMWRQRAPGGTCLTALAEGGRGTPALPMNNSKGCGGVMRVAPIGVMRGLGDASARYDLAERAAALTHGHPGGFRPAGAMAVMLFALINGASLAEALGNARSCLGPAVDGDGTDRLLGEAQRLAARPTDDHPAHVARLGEGWVGDEALAIAVYATLAAGSFGEALQIAANHDGDSDSTASLAGQIWAAGHGLDGIPQAWITDLDLFEVMVVLLRYLVWPDVAVR